MSQKLKSALIAAGLTGALAILSQHALADSHGSGNSMAKTTEANHSEQHNDDQHHSKEYGHKGMDKKFNSIANALKLDASQQAAWNELKLALQPKHLDKKKSREAHKTALKEMRTPERLDWMQGMFESRLNDMKTRNQAIKSFYATLNDEQKKVFDDQFFWSRSDKKMHHGSSRHD